MKLGAYSVLFQNLSLEETINIYKASGLEAIELGVGGYPGKAHCDPSALLRNPSKMRAFRDLFLEANITISGLSCHGNPLHPNKEIAQSYHNDFMDALALASELDINTVIGFSGCPGDSDNAKYPNWPVAPWPNEYSDLLKWQWEEKLIPYWQTMSESIKNSGIKIALEMHGGFLVHTPATLLKLRSETGKNIGANLDPSHMWWQGVDPVEAIKILGKQDALFYFHAKDTAFDTNNTNLYGLTDMQSYANHLTRSWNFRSVGYGHNIKVWADIISALRLVGYDSTISIEHEDGLMSIEEGLSKAITNLKQIMIKDKASEMWWI